MRLVFEAKRMTASVALLALAGCVSFGGKVPDQLISLTPQTMAPAGDIGSGQVGQEIIVLDPDTDRRLDVARVPVQINNSAIAYIEGAQWVEKPARQFRRLLAETIRAKTGRIVVEGADFDASGKTVVSGRLIDMGYDARDLAVVVRYDAILEAGDGAIRSRRFEARVPGVTAQAAPVGAALNEAANDIAGQVADWVSG